jgi:hypothetical protein
VKPVPGTSGPKVKLPGSDKFVPLDQAESIPPGTIIDVTGSPIVITDPSGKQMEFYGQPDGVISEFEYGGVVNGVVQIILVGGNFSSYRITQGGQAKKPNQPVRRLWGNGKGKFTTKGKFASATVRGTNWLIADFKTGTRVYVHRGLVAVRDFVKKKTVLVKAGHSYFAAKKTSKKT